MFKRKKMNKRKKVILMAVIFSIIFLSLILINFFLPKNNNSLNYKEFNECLSQRGVVFYGTTWCPACSNLVEILGGYDAVSPIYVNCMENRSKCDQEKKTGYVPEIHINGEIYTGSQTIRGFASATGCSLPKN